MTISISDEEWDELALGKFDTTALLRAVDAVDEMRGDYPAAAIRTATRAKAADLLPLLADGPPPHTGPAIIGDTTMYCPPTARARSRCTATGWMSARPISS